MNVKTPLEIVCGRNDAASAHSLLDRFYLSQPHLRARLQAFTLRMLSIEHDLRYYELERSFVSVSESYRRALSIAMDANHVAVVRELLFFSPQLSAQKIPIRYAAFHSVLHHAIDSNSIESLNVFLEMTADTDLVRCNEGYTSTGNISPLMFAIINRRYACALRLAEDIRTDVNFECNFGPFRNPLQTTFISMPDHAELIHVLRSRGASSDL